MSLHIYDDLEQGTEEWHDQRRGMVTASVVGQLLTPTLKVADNDTSRALTRLLVAERITGYTDPTYQNDDMFRGVMEEPRAREKYREHYGSEVVECGFMVRDDWGFSLGYSPDGLVGDDGLIEVKSPRAKNHLATILSGEVPAFYMTQLQCGLLVSGREWIDYVSYCGGMAMWVKRVLPDPLWHDAILEAVDAFEVNAWAFSAGYREVAEGFPMTERLDTEVVI